MIIIQNAFGDALDIAKVSSAIWKVYADHHNYTYILSSDPAPRPDLKPPWSKLTSIIRALQQAPQGEIILYVDVDAVPLPSRMAEALDTVLGADQQLGMVLSKESAIIDTSTRQWFNAGVIFVRATPAMIAFFQQVLVDGNVPGQEWVGEQARMNENIKTSGLSVQTLDNQYNAYTMAPSKTPFIRAFHGEVDKKNAVRLMGLVLSGKLPPTFGMRL